ncbi:hypothetical protein [Streptomyces sp. A012304]|uniref:hypothetical protein n=1 Tax=Streptomyces sp. A012304 TaxID=375446 RepID=UPI00222F1755|nr:hypothetical protein [Streptomyces sp. A012304]GKQ40273.1 hypothetical protein ALMP_67990 [Streptomyces sp. A012304]
MAGRVRRCAYVLCSKPLPQGSRSDKRFCGRACQAARRRWLRHQWEAFAIGLAFLLGEEPEQICALPGVRAPLRAGPPAPQGQGLRPELLPSEGVEAVSQRSNRQKPDQDVAEWLPIEAAHCRYLTC